jgi:glycosyltransferase involved in cell wall biosynthesis
MRKSLQHKKELRAQWFARSIAKSWQKPYNQTRDMTKLPLPETTERIGPFSHQDGISVILCCHNSATRLRDTLEALSKQYFPENPPTELILVDNASTDSTVSTAQETWRILKASMPMRVVYESKPGLIHARQTGISVANFEILIFCDDDNLFEPDYVMLAYKHFNRRPTLAAMGGFGVPVFEIPPPAWFSVFASSYATGSQRITSESGKTLNLYGAGLAVRKSALAKLYSTGYRPMLTGRKGTALSSAEDTEMTYALVIAGYELDYDDQMRFRHLLPASRLHFKYLERLFLSSAVDGPVRNLYHAFATHRRIQALMKYWPWHFMIALLRIPKYTINPPKPGYRQLYFRWSIQYMSSLISLLPQYHGARKNISRIPALANKGTAPSYAPAKYHKTAGSNR